jgi:YfiH family protein
VNEVKVLRSELLATPHGFFGRRGGVSTGQMWGLNVGYGSGDDPDLIAENRRRAVEAVLPGAQLATVHQVHSPTAVHVEHTWPQDERPHADAMVTNRPGILLGVLAADCAPVLFVDSDAGVVGAAHSGWRGAFGGVNEATIDAMEGVGAQRERIAAVVGPSVSQASYEVDQGFRDRFLQQDEANERFFVEGSAGKPHFDLPSYILHRLDKAGIRRAEALRLDTYSDPDLFYSYRRSTHLGEPSYGRQISLIGLPPGS